MLTCRPRADVSCEDWDGVVHASEDGWLWHLNAFQDALATWWDRTDAGFAVCEGDEVLAVVPLQRLQQRIFRKLPCPTLASLGGPAVAEQLTGRSRERVESFAYAALAERAARLGVTALDVTLSPLSPAGLRRGPAAANPLLAHGFTDTSGSTWVVDLRAGETAAWDRMRQRGRRTVRKAVAQGVSTRPATAGDLDEYYRLHVSTYQRTGVRPHPKAYFEHIWRDFVATGRSQVLVAELEGQVVAARNYGVFKGTSIYWTGASDDGSALSSGANALLEWEATRMLVERGVLWHESGEAHGPDESPKLQSLSHFKEGFGGDRWTIPRGRRSGGARLARALMHLRSRLR